MSDNTRLSTYDRIKKNYPDINIEWLRFGTGKMCDEFVADYATKPYDSMRPHISYTTGRPYYNVDFIAGFNLIVNDQTITPQYLIDFKKYDDAQLWCNVTGHSMEPLINHGDIIAIKELMTWREFMPSGEIYGIVTDEMRTIKKVASIPDDDNYLLLIPENKSPEYVPQRIPKSIIRRVFAVLGCMKNL